MRTFISLFCAECGHLFDKEARIVKSVRKIKKTSDFYCSPTCYKKGRNSKLKNSRQIRKAKNIENLPIKFFQKVNKTPGLGPKEDCWEWTTTLDNGYGVFCCFGKWHYAHRYSYSLHNNLKLEDFKHKVIMHSCDNKLCVNPSHLVLGTIQENNLDKYLKQRHIKGSANIHAKLTEQSIPLIRKMINHLGKSCKEVAKEFNVSSRTISSIASCKTWSHIKTDWDVLDRSNLAAFAKKDLEDININKFLNLFTKTEGCWEWKGHLVLGYGKLNNIAAHRISYVYYKGPIIKGLLVRHICHNKACVNPEHLILGTRSENYQDSYLEGNMSVGENSNKAKLTESQVLEIRSLYATRGKSQAELARIYKVSIWTIHAIIKRRSWKHLLDSKSS